MKPRALRVLVLGLVLSGVLAAGCGEDNTSPTSPTTPAGPVTETFTSNLTVQGSAWRLISAAQGGTLSATITSASQPSSVVGFGLGIQGGSTTGCLLSHAVTAAAGSAPQLTAPIDAGVYCVKIFDVGGLSDPMGFTITIVRP